MENICTNLFQAPELTRVTTDSWNPKMELSIMPTEDKDLSVSIANNQMTLIGKSETESDKNGLKLKSTHQWRREFTIPKNVNLGSIKVKLDKSKLKLTITSDVNADTVIPITMDE